MSELINITKVNSYVNKDVGNVNSENTPEYGDSSNVKTLDKNEQESILSSYINDFENSGFTTDDSMSYYEKDCQDYKEFLRVIDDNGVIKVLHTTVQNGSNEGNVDLHEITKADEFAKWNKDNNENVKNNGADISQVEDFTISDKAAVSSTYLNNFENFAQQYVNKYDTDKNGTISYDEYSAMSDYEGKGQSDDVKKKLFDDMQMDDDKTSISTKEFVAHFMTTDVDYKNLNKDSSPENAMDGKINFETYNSFGNDINSSDYQNEVNIRQSFYNRKYSS